MVDDTVVKMCCFVFVVAVLVVSKKKKFLKCAETKKNTASKMNFISERIPFLQNR